MPNTTSAAAESGTRVHEAIDYYIAHGELPEVDLTPREAFIARWFGDVVNRERGQAQPQHIMTTDDKLVMIMLYGPNMPAHQMRWTGHPDRVEWFEDHIDIWEYKTGYGKQLDANAHPQGRMYVAMVADSRNLEHLPIILHLMSAGEDHGEWHTQCVFDAKAQTVAVTEAKHIAMSVLNNPDHRNADPGNQCKYCRAAGNAVRCPESVKACVAVEIPPIVLPSSAKDIADAYGKWMDLKAKLRAVQLIGEKIEDSMKTLLKCGQAPEGCGWKILPDTEQRRVTAAMKVWEVVQDELTAEEFGDLIKLSFSDLEKAIYRVKKADDKKTTHESVEAELRAALEAAGCIKRVPVEGKIVREG